MLSINDSAVAAARRRVASDLWGVVSGAAEVSRASTPVDTSSLRESIQPSIYIDGSKIHLIISAGGEDYSDQVMPTTGQIGNAVDYAIYQEAIHGFLELGLAAILGELRKNA